MFKRLLLALALGGALIACTPAPGATTAPSVAAPTVAPSEAAPSDAAPSESAPMESASPAAS